jgi:ketosteroid isomerase-like protein
MDNNRELIERFYNAFQRLDYTTMNSCYSDDIVFNDPVFGLLNADEVKAMWEMLCKSAKNFLLTYSNIHTDDKEYYTCTWSASYTFSRTGRKVINDIKAYMRIKDGKIVEHSDGFRLSSWIAQAFGWKGVMFGWTSFMKKAVQKNAMKNLQSFMAKKNEQNNSA